jgi:hypothetical protein
MPDPRTPAFDQWLDDMFAEGQELIESMSWVWTEAKAAPREIFPLTVIPRTATGTNSHSITTPRYNA